MNKLAHLFLAVFALLSISVNAQDYLNHTARWHQRYAWYGFQANTECFNTYYINGDSIINDTAYYKIYNDGYCVLSHMEYDEFGVGTMVSDTNFYDNMFHLLIREQNRRVYTRQGTTTDYLLYNFELGATGITDEFTPYPSCGISDPSYTLLDTVCIGEIARKRWSVSFSQYPMANFIIEGVGASSGFLAPVCRNGCPECSYSLLNFTLNGDTLYQGNCSMPTLLTEQEPLDEVKWQQLPNEIICLPPSDGQFTLWTLDGKLLLQQKVKAHQAAGFRLDQQPAGMYIARLDYASHLSTIQFVNVGR